MTATRVIGRTVLYLLLAVSSFIMIYPVLFLVLGAFTTDERFFETRFLPIPNHLNLAWIWEALEWMQRAYLVTLLRVGFYLVISLLVGLIAGYIFSRMRFPGRDKLFLLLLSGLVMPAILMIVPQYMLAARWPLAGGNDLFGQGGHGFIGEWPVLFLYGWVPPFAIFLFKQNFDMLPADYEEAAKMDGAGMFTIIFRVYGPMLRPAIAALTIVTFLAIWNDFLWPSLTVSGNSDWQPISYLIGNAGQNGISANPAVFNFFMLAMWPPAAAYFLLQRYFVQGLVASGIKG
jgi:multiple sugar transport system permease protein